MEPDASRRIIPPPASKIPPPPPAASIPATAPIPGEALPPIHIAMKDVHKAFGSKRVLNGVNLDIPRGKSVVIIGGSGTGKSVTLKCILGLLHPDGGSILVNGKEAIGQSASDREEMLNHFGMLFQGSALFDSLPVWQNVAFGLIQGRGTSRAEARQIAIEKLAQVGLGPEIADLSPSELSGGMQKRVGLARAIATDPDIIFFDEPTTGLDPIMADIINDLIVKCVREVGATAITITHDMASACKIGDKIAMIYEGKIIWEGSPDEVENSGNDFVEQFVKGAEEGPIQVETFKG